MPQKFNQTEIYFYKITIKGKGHIFYTHIPVTEQELEKAKEHWGYTVADVKQWLEEAGVTGCEAAMLVNYKDQLQLVWWRQRTTELTYDSIGDNNV